MPTTRRCRCSRRERARPRPAGTGSICATSARTPALPRPPCSIATRPTAKASTAAAELANFTGWLHADGYAGFGRLYEIARTDREALPLQGPPRVAEVGCWAHVRRGFFDELKSNGSPIAKEALDRIGALFDIERLIAGAPRDHRKSVRQRMAKPRIDDFATWLDAQLLKIPGRAILPAPSAMPAHGGRR